MSNKFAQALKTPSKSEMVPLPVDNPVTTPSPHDRPSRKGVKHVGGYFQPQVSKQLRQIALDEDSSVQDLLAEALDMLFHSRQKPTIARKPAIIQA